MKIIIFVAKTAYHENLSSTSYTYNNNSDIVGCHAYLRLQTKRGESMLTVC